MTLVYQINEGTKRLLFVVEDREENSLRQFFDWLGEERSALADSDDVARPNRDDAALGSEMM
jgi:hypothetical protein